VKSPTVASSCCPTPEPVTSAPPAAAAVFGQRLDLAAAYVDLLATVGVERGLLGPREAPRLWDRHVLNCAVVSDLLPEHTRVVDVGSGAGLPGLALAIRRPDLRVDLVESLQRRTSFLTEAVDALGLGDSVRVVRGRAEDATVQALVGDAPWVTARAVAPLDRLVRWCLPLLADGGTLLAIKGAQAESEISAHRSVIRRLGGDPPIVRDVGTALLPEPTMVVVVRKSAASARREDAV